ncbi:MAG: ABC transporter permease subunit, partial [Candidatus Binatia bacterium]
MKNWLLNIGLLAYIGSSALLVFQFPQSILAFLLFEASLLLIYTVPMRRGVKMFLAAGVLGILMPLVGTINGYYLEIAVQIGIFVALALGLNIVVGFAGLLNLGFVAFYAIGAYLWAIFGSAQANHFLPGGYFPLAGSWFFVFVVFGALAGALTGT